MLFYYFNSKLELYTDLTNYCLQFIENEYIPLTQNAPTDFIEKYRYLSTIKLKSFHDHPYLFHFMKRVYLEMNDGFLAKDAIDRIMEMRAKTLADTFANVDTSRFRKDIPQEKLLQVIQYCMDGYEQQLIEKIKTTWLDDSQYKQLWDDFYDFLDSLKLIFYSS